MCILYNFNTVCSKRVLFLFMRCKKCVRHFFCGREGILCVVCWLFVVKGIYRLSGVKSQVEQLCQSFEMDEHVIDLSEHQPNVIANVLKLYFRQVSLTFYSVLPSLLSRFILCDENHTLAWEWCGVGLFRESFWKVTMFWTNSRINIVVWWWIVNLLKRFIVFCYVDNFVCLIDQWNAVFNNTDLWSVTFYIVCIILQWQSISILLCHCKVCCDIVKQICNMYCTYMHNIWRESVYHCQNEFVADARAFVDIQVVSWADQSGQSEFDVSLYCVHFVTVLSRICYNFTAAVKHCATALI